MYILKSKKQFRFVRGISRVFEPEENHSVLLIPVIFFIENSKKDLEGNPGKHLHPSLNIKQHTSGNFICTYGNPRGALPV